MLTDDDLEPRSRPKKPKPLDTMSIDELDAYVTDLRSEIARVESAIKVKQAHIAAMATMFKTPG